MPDFLGTDFRFFAGEILGRKSMKPYPMAEELLRPIARVAVLRAVGSAAFLARYPPTRETKNLLRASANSSTWWLKGVRYLFEAPIRDHVDLM